jgi:hypothetical protein
MDIRIFLVNGFDERLFEENKYFRMTAGKDPGLSETAQKSSEKITMVADDIMDLSIQIGEGKTVQFGSSEFFESSANRFIQSFVHTPATEGGFTLPETINVIFNPRDLSQSSYEDLANQVIGAQVRRYNQTSSMPHVPTRIKEDFDAISGRLFGKSYEQASKDLVEAGTSMEKVFAKGLGLAERQEILRAAGMRPEAEQLGRYVESVAVEIKEDGIASFKYMGEAAEDIRTVQKLSGNEALIMGNDDLTRNIVSRGTQIITAEATEGGRQTAIGMIMSPYSNEVAANHAAVAAGAVEASSPEEIRAAVSAAARETDIDALTKLEEAIPLASVVPTTETVGSDTVRTATPVADEALQAGRQFFKKNKTGIYLAGLAVAAAVIGKKAADRKNESDLYDSTMGVMPVESGQRPYGIQDAMFSTKTVSRRRDPLTTAGVVGNLDRNKINHTSMGSDKNNHLFGG